MTNAPLVRILAIDPGLTGALACLAFDPHTRQLVDPPAVLDMPVVSTKVGPKTRNDILEAGLVEAVRQMRPTIAYVERVQPMRGEGAVGAFKFGAGWGLVRGVLAGMQVPTRLVTPQSWKKRAGLPTGASKDMSRQLASRLYPQLGAMFLRKKDDGRAEAVILAHIMAQEHLAGPQDTAPQKTRKTIPIMDAV